MCGITGIFSAEDFFTASLIHKMTESIKHRGPDDEGYLSYNTETKELIELSGNDSKIKKTDISKTGTRANLFLGHRRLSIIDLSESGHQPFFNVIKDKCIVFNGEIYNYIEIREELRSLGYQFKSNTDTEVLLNAYTEWGSGCVNRFNGMWAFAILDFNKNLLFVSRDRFGVKPFYYFSSGKYFAFSSEIKALLTLPFNNRNINTTAVYDYLVLSRTESDNESFFKNIYELEPGNNLTLKLSNCNFKIEKNFKLGYCSEYKKFDQKKSEEYVEETKHYISNAVRLRLRSDVIVGSCLSGGIDSSAVVSLANEMLQDSPKQKVFTASYKNNSIDESNWAEIVVKEKNLEWYKTFPDAVGLLDDLEKIVYHQDIPFDSTSIYSQYKVMELAKTNNVPVLLDGQGADELFGGYTYFFRAFVFEILKNYDFNKIFAQFRFIKNSPINVNTLIVELLKGLAKKFIPSGFKSKIVKHKNTENLYINNELWERNIERLQSVKGQENTNLNDELFKQFTQTSLKKLLKFEDRNSMAFSIEARTPFADDINLIEYLFRVPSAYKIHNGWTKYLLRESMKGILPERIRLRTDKVGFATPEYAWVQDLKDEFSDYLTNDLNDFFDVRRFKNNLDGIFKTQTKQGITTIWRFINFAVWKKVFRV